MWSTKEKGSISDEIVYFVPVRKTDGVQGMSFVMDRVYESKSSDILLAHIKAVTKKYSSLKKDFPDAKISVFVTDSALSSVGLTREQAQLRISEIFNEVKISYLDGAIVNILESALGDHYVEFGEHIGRYKGKTTVSGLEIKA